MTATVSQRSGPETKYVVAIDLGTSGTAWTYHARTRTPDAARLTVFAPGRRLLENQGKAPTAVLLSAAPGNALEALGEAAYDDWTRAEEEGAERA
jgi:hypothetical protein